MIGIFDSGFGGLTIFKHIAARLPQHDFVYLGDNARAPYGNRSQETIYQFTVEAVDWLFKQGCTLIVLACNTASAEALRKIQQEYLLFSEVELPLGSSTSPHRRVLGVIRPIVEEAARVSRGGRPGRASPSAGRIGVVGTRATIASHAYERELKKLKPDVIVFEQACPLLVPLIEEGWAKKGETKRILRMYLQPLKLKQLDALILGCTHYPILLQDFVAKMGKRCTVLNPGPIVASKLADYLTRHPEIESTLSKNGSTRFCTTDTPQRFDELGSRFFGKPIAAEQVRITPLEGAKLLP